MLHPFRLLFGLVVLALAAWPVRADEEVEKPTRVEIDQALDDLKIDTRDDGTHALKVLARAKDRKLYAAIALHGATTQHVIITVLAGTLLAEAGPDEKHEVAATQLKTLLRSQKKKPEGLVRVAMMAELTPGRVGRTILESLIKHRQTKVASTAIRALGIRHEEASRSALITLLKSPRAPVATAAAFALAQLSPDKPTIDAMFKRVVSGNFNDRVGDACAVALMRMPADPALGARVLALIAKRSGKDAIHGLTKVAMRHAVASNFVRKDQTIEEQAIFRLIDASNPRAREIGADLAGYNRMGSPTMQGKLLNIAQSEHDWRVRVAAWLALTRTGVEHVIPQIISNIKKAGEPSYWAIQCAGADPHPQFAGALRNAAVDVKDPFRRKVAARALRAQKDHAATLKHFFDFIMRNGLRKRRSLFAMRAIGHLKDQRSFEVLVKLLERAIKLKDKKAQLGVIKGLEDLTGHYFEPDPEVWREWYEVVNGQVAFDPKPIDRKANRERIKKTKSFGISPKTENAVEQGLLWLARHQDTDGGWNGATYHRHCPANECREQGGMRDRPLAYTALAMLAFQGAGYTHLDGPYRNIMQRGFEYILTQSEYDGRHREGGWTFSYEAAILCQSLCDSYALTGDPWIKIGAQRMIDYMVKIQYPGKNWRYHVRSRETDTSIMSWVLTGMVSARHADLDIADQIYVAAEAWLDLACDPLPPDTYEVFIRLQYDKNERYAFDVRRDKRGKIRTYKLKTWYQPPRLYTPAMSSIGILCRIWLGWTRAHPFCIGCANTVMDSIPGYGTGLLHEYAFYPYTWYYGSLAMYQMGGKYWSRWREKCIRDLIDHQKRSGHEKGSWPMPREQFVAGLTGGRIYCTAMSILTLESFYRYQPYLARHDVRSRIDETGDKKSDSKLVKPGDSSSDTDKKDGAGKPDPSK